MKVETFEEYQRAAARTWIPMANQVGDLQYLALGLAGEAGEVAELIKKIRHGIPLDKEKLRAELGDVLWYVAILAQETGLVLEWIAETNVEKLRARYPEGFEDGGGNR